MKRARTPSKGAIAGERTGRGKVQICTELVSFFVPGVPSQHPRTRDLDLDGGGSLSRGEMLIPLGVWDWALWGLPYLTPLPPSAPCLVPLWCHGEGEYLVKVKGEGGGQGTS